MLNKVAVPDTSSDAIERVRSLELWKEPVEPQPVSGGLSNVNFRVDDGSKSYFARICEDSPYHHVFRDIEARISRSAHAAGISPELIHYEPGIMVFEFIEARTFTKADVNANIERMVPLIRRVHTEMPHHVRGPSRMFWVFHVLRDYAHVMREGNSRSVALLPEYMAIAERLEAEIGSIDVVFGHHDLLPANFMDDGERLWLIDWEYGSFGTPLFDIAGMSAMADFSHDDDRRLLEAYFEERLDDTVRRKFSAMRCAAALREVMWSMVSEMHLTPPPGADYEAYSEENKIRFQTCLDMFEEEFGTGR